MIVRGWVIHNAYESPYESKCVCLCIFELVWEETMFYKTVFINSVAQ